MALSRGETTKIHSKFITFTTRRRSSGPVVVVVEVAEHQQQQQWQERAFWRTQKQDNSIPMVLCGMFYIFSSLSRNDKTNEPGTIRYCRPAPPHSLAGPPDGYPVDVASPYSSSSACPPFAPSASWQEVGNVYARTIHRHLDGSAILLQLYLYNHHASG